jgi:hypothetical protein
VVKEGVVTTCCWALTTHNTLASRNSVPGIKQGMLALVGQVMLRACVRLLAVVVVLLLTLSGVPWVGLSWLLWLMCRQLYMGGLLLLLLLVVLAVVIRVGLEELWLLLLLLLLLLLCCRWHIWLRL